MSMADLRDDIIAYLSTRARGRENAMPRRELATYLRGIGYGFSDRTLRRTYASINAVGYSCREPRGLYWIMTAEDQRVTIAQRHSQAMACLVHEHRTRKEGETVGQQDLWP